MLDILLLFIGTIGLLIGTITDFQRREVADYVNYFLIIAGLSLRLLGSVYYQDIWYFLIPFGWFLVAYGFGLLMYYTGQWGGGDAKMIMGLSAVFGTVTFASLSYDPLMTFFSVPFAYNIFFFPHFLFNAFFFGAIYSIFFTVYLVFLHKNSFLKDFQERFKRMKSFYFTTLFLLGVVYISYTVLVQQLFVLHVAYVGIVVLPLLYVYVKSVESSCMIKNMHISELTEGEWILHPVIIDGKKICGPDDLGISLKQIKDLQTYFSKGKITHVAVKVGIPFVPAFFIAFIFTYFFGNILFLVL